MFLPYLLIVILLFIVYSPLLLRGGRGRLFSVLLSVKLSIAVLPHELCIAGASSLRCLLEAVTRFDCVW